MERVEGLRGEVGNLAKEVGSLRQSLTAVHQQLHRRTQAFVCAVAVGFVVLLFVVGAAYAVSLRNQQSIEDNNRKLCPMIGLLFPRLGDTKPSTARGNEISQKAQELYQLYGCN